jgi:hypothetical protein
MSLSAPASGRRRAERAPLLAVALAVLVLAGALLIPARPAAAGSPPDEVLPAVLDAYGSTGVLAAVIARQHRVVPGLSIGAAEARSVRTAEAWAGNEHADRVFPTASMVKLFMAEDLLHRARGGAISLDGATLDQMRRMISSSDDPAASALWVRFDGPRMVRAVAERYGLRATAPPVQPGQWGRTTTTATDLARFLTLLPVVAHERDAATLLRWMAEVTPVAADGFDQRFGLYSAKERAEARSTQSTDGASTDGDSSDSDSSDSGRVPVAVKQGWMCCVDGQRHVHSVGVVGRTVVVLLSEVPRAVGYDWVRAMLTAAAAEVPLPADR